MIAQIEKIVQWYARLPSDYRDVNGLMTVRVRLSALLCQFAQDRPKAAHRVSAQGSV